MIKKYLQRHNTSPDTHRQGAQAALSRYRAAARAFEFARSEGEIDCAIYEMAAARREYARFSHSSKPR